jgi:protein-S-isoprenylcysteine O-methyltransferase Ste14
MTAKLLTMEPQVFAGNPDSSVLIVVIYWAVFYLWFFSEMFLGWRLTRRKSKAAVDRDAGSKWVLISSIWLGMALGVTLAVVAPSLAIRSDRHLLFAVGIALALAGMALRWYSIWFLGQAFTCEVATRPDQSVVDRGPYRWLRHPSYTGGLLTVAGLLLCVTNVLAFAGFLIALGGYGYRIRVEEHVLATELGEPYRQYMKKTRRLIPFVL